METVERSAAINQYPSISLSGNPRAIIGNVYGLDHEVVHASTHVERRTPRLKSLQVQFRGEQENLAMVFTGFPVLLLQDYEEVKSSINLLRDFDKEIEKCAKHIGVRHALFRQSLKEFLGSHIGLDVAQQMLSDLHHPTWADDIFKQHVQERHGSNMSAIQHALDLISISLEGIMSFSERCALLRDGAPKEKSILPFKDARRRIKSKVGLFATEGKLREILRELKVHTDDFRTLTQLSNPPAKQDEASAPSSQTKLKTNRYQRVQEAAGSLYRSFGLACTKHSRHQAQLRLEASIGNSTQVQFTLLLEHIGLLVASKGSPSLRLTVESQMTGTLSDPSTSSALSGLASSLAACNKRAPEVLLGESEGNSTGSLRQAASDLRRSAENTTRPGKLSKQRKTVDSHSTQSSSR